MLPRICISTQPRYRATNSSWGQGVFFFFHLLTALGVVLDTKGILDMLSVKVRVSVCGREVRRDREGDVEGQGGRREA